MMFFTLFSIKSATHEKQIEAMMSKIENWINAGKRLLISISKTKTTTELSTARFE